MTARMDGALALGLVLVSGGALAQNNLFYWPVANANAPICAYVDDSGKDWKCGGNFYSGHKGTDIAVGVGTDVLAASSGTVNHSVDGCPYGAIGNYCGGGFGNAVAIFHGSGVETIYGHMTSGSGIAPLNSSVGCGQRLGGSGSSGNSSGPHMHFEVRLNVAQSSYYSGYPDDPFAGPCGGPLSYWKNQGSGYAGSCGTAPSPQSATSCGQAACPSGTYPIWTCNSGGTARVRCQNGAVQTESCPNGCQSNPVGTDDVCNTPACPAGTYSIWTCNSGGTERVRCQNGNVEREACANGCQVNPVGTDDVCKPPPACPSGTYPLWNCDAAKTSRTRCTNGNVETQSCQYGCTVMPNGTDDVCAAPSCPSGTYPLWNCSADGSERVRCENGNVQHEACPNGCQVMPNGTDDVCKAPPACPADLSASWSCNATGTVRERCVNAQVEQEQCPDGCDQPATGDATCRAPPPCPEGTSQSWACTKDGTTKTRCVNGATEQLSCPGGCVSPDAGESFCGASACPPGVGAEWSCTPDSNARVRCGSGGFEVQGCSKGCVVEDGLAHCRGISVCGDGVYAKWTCTADGSARLRCDGETVSSETCLDGCVTNPAGADDECKAGSGAVAGGCHCGEVPGAMMVMGLFVAWAMRRRVRVTPG